MSYTKDEGKRDDTALIARFNKWDSALDAHWGGWRDEARECFGMVAGHQVPQKLKEEAENGGAAYAVLNKIDSTISAICGSEINGRQEVRYYPREMSERGPDGQLLDAKVNEILTGAAEWVRDECDAAEEESQAFRDCVICGVGVTETRMDYEEDPEGMPRIERVDPLEIGIDPAARRPNAVDARYLRRKRRFSKDEAAERFGLDVNAMPAQRRDAPSEPHANDPGSAYEDKADAEAPLGKDQIEVTEYQWFESISAYVVLNPATGQLEQLPQEAFERLQGAGLDYQRIKVRKYRRAYRIAEQLLEVGDLPDAEFTLKIVTGKHDRNRGVWYGVVRAMIDPQRLINKMVSQVQRIIDHNAKGGLLAEVDAFEDPRQAEEEWSRSDSIVWVKNGMLGQHPRVMPKPVSPYPSAIDKLFAVMDEAVPGVSGVNKEMLGVVERDQAGILDYQRKQAAYSVLAGFFDSLRRYRRLQGRHLLKLINKYMSDGRLIRIVGRHGNVQYTQLAKQAETAKYDVIVDEAPAGPNQKERTFAFLQSPFGAEIMKQAQPAIQLKFLEFTPLPTSLISEMQQIAENMPEQKDPALVKAETDAQIRTQQMQADAQAAAAKLQQEREASVARLELQAQEAAAALMQRREQAQMESELARDKAEQEAALAMWKAQQEFELAKQRAAWERELEQERLDSQHEIGMERASMNGAGLSKNRPGGSLSE